MRLWIGVTLLALGILTAMVGYAPIGSAYVISLPLIAIGGTAITAGTFMVMVASARRNDTDDVDRDQLIRG